MRQQEQVHRKELKNLMRSQRREGVNMEYLKNVVLQYMQYRPAAHSNEQKGLAPVIFMLLQVGGWSGAAMVVT